MTLIIIEIEVPHVLDYSEEEMTKNTNELFPKFVSFFIGFFV